MKRKPKRLNLRDWCELDDLRRDIETQAKNEDFIGVSKTIRKIISLSIGKEQKNKFWIDDMELFVQTLGINATQKQFPILSTKKEGKSLPWEYSGRTWYFWLNTFALSYGWTEKEVGEMDIDDAIGLYQEIAVEEQLEREWQNSLSEISYAYNKTTKQSKLIELPRPDWMKHSAEVVGNQNVKTFKMPVQAMPLGVVITLDEKDGKNV